jgi:hypothetical protein
MQRLQFGQERGGADALVAGIGRGMGGQSSPDTDDEPFEFRRDAV